MTPAPRVFTGCTPAVACDAGGRIVAVGADALDFPGAARVNLRGRALPGLTDSHIHLGWMARGRIRLDLGKAASRDDALLEIFLRAMELPEGAWLVGHGLDDSAWPVAERLTLGELDVAAAGHPLFVHRRDTHSAWVNSEALAAAGIDATTPDPPGGVIDHDESGELGCIVRENAAEQVRVEIPDPPLADLVAALREVVDDLARLGLTGVHSIDSPEDHALLGQLRDAGRLPLRVSGYLPAAHLDELIAGGVRAGQGDARVRVAGIKLFLDGSLGSGTAEMLDGSGVQVTDDEALHDALRRAHDGELNVAIHAIGDGAVRRALGALQQLGPTWPAWRPRIEHVQCIDPADAPRFAQIGVVASMQPVHAVSDRAVADERWSERVTGAYAWQTLHQAGARLAFGSDAPVDSPDPLLGIRAATTWRAEHDWHPQLAVSEEVAIEAYTSGAAYAAGMETELGRLEPGQWCDLTVVDGDEVVATVVAGEPMHGGAPTPSQDLRS